MPSQNLKWLPFPLMKSMVNKELLVDKFGCTLSRNMHLGPNNKKGWSRFNISRTSPEYKDLVQKISTIESQNKPKVHHDGSMMLSHMQNLN